MTDRFVIPLVNGEWLALDEEQFTTALAAGRKFARPAIPNLVENMAPQPLLNSADMAALLGCNDTTVEQMAKDHRIPSVRIGKLLRFEPHRVLEALRDATRS